MNTKLHPSAVLRLDGWRGTYDFAVAWIAINSPVVEMFLVDDLSVVLIADLFGKEPQQVAHDVVAMRRREDRSDEKFNASQMRKTVRDARSRSK